MELNFYGEVLSSVFLDDYLGVTLIVVSLSYEKVSSNVLLLLEEWKSTVLGLEQKRVAEV